MTSPHANPTDRRTQSRRKHTRAIIEWPVTVISTTGSYQGKAANLSRGGALIYLSHELTIGEDVRLAFEIPDYQDVIVAKGEILRVFILKRGVEQEFTHGAALQFTEISDENLKYFTGDIAPEWKADYRDPGPIIDDKASAKVSRNRSYVPWIFVLILLIPLLYFVYDATQRRLDGENLLSEVEKKLLIIEEQIDFLQNSLDLLMPLEGQINDLQIEVSNITNRLPNAVSIEKMTQQITTQIDELANITQKISDINESNLKLSENGQQKMERQHIYVVQKGDNLFQISSKNNISMQKLREINGIGPDEAIFPGQTLMLR